MLLVSITLVTGCGKKKEKNEDQIPNNDIESPIIENTSLEGLEFMNIAVNGDVLTTIVINNTGHILKETQFSMKVTDIEGNIVVELIEQIDSEMETGTTKTIETKTNVDLSNAASIEYSVIQ